MLFCLGYLHNFERIGCVVIERVLNAVDQLKELDLQQVDVCACADWNRDRCECYPGGIKKEPKSLRRSL